MDLNLIISLINLVLKSINLILEIGRKTHNNKPPSA